MVKPIYLALGAIPVIVALLISVPLLTKNEIPISAANSIDKIQIEYTKHQLKKISYGVTKSGLNFHPPITTINSKKIRCLHCDPVIVTIGENEKYKCL